MTSQSPGGPFFDGTPLCSDPRWPLQIMDVEAFLFSQPQNGSQPSLQQPLNILMPSQASLVNPSSLMLQSLLPPHSLQSPPPNTANPYLFVSQPGSLESGGRTLNPSPNSASGHQPSCGTPPIMDHERNWTLPHNIYLGGPHLSDTKNLEETESLCQIPNYLPLSQMEGFAANLAAAAVVAHERAGLIGPPPLIPELHRFIPYGRPPNQSPSQLMQGRPEDLSSNYGSSDYEPKEDLIIGSWTGEEESLEKVNHFGGGNPYMLSQQKNLEDKLTESRNFQLVSGWGAPPPGASWSHVPPSWNQPPPPLPSQTSESHLRFRPGLRPRNSKPIDHIQEKVNGKKNAIAETTAMMMKMRLAEAGSNESTVSIVEDSRNNRLRHHRDPNRDRSKGGRGRGASLSQNNRSMAGMFMTPPPIHSFHPMDGYLSQFPPFSGHYPQPPPPPHHHFTSSYSSSPGFSVPHGGRLFHRPPRMTTNHSFRGTVIPTHSSVPIASKGKGQSRSKGKSRSYSNDKTSRTSNGGTEEEEEEELEVADKADRISENSKNWKSGQGKTKGQLALSAIRNAPIENLDLRERLTRQLVENTIECMVCLDKVRSTHQIWNCSACFQIFHLNCIKKWSSSLENEGWRCPGCQNVLYKVPTEYFCFCRKIKYPEVDFRECPHSCGKPCLKTRGGCPHKCVILCHPGPCPPCLVNTFKTCFCQKTSGTTKCKAQIICDKICGKELNCNLHFCERKCHNGECNPCSKINSLYCTCHDPKEKQWTCGSENINTFLCGDICGKLLSCGNHFCNYNCHSEPCNECDLLPEKVLTCPCGKMSLNSSERTSCTDNITLCKNTCDKLMPCGHHCQMNCHLGPCASCPLSSKIKCRCGFMEKDVSCEILKNSQSSDVRCDKRCSRKTSCGRHKCMETCCIRVEHFCTKICSKLLSCGIHRCTEFCHPGHCSNCMNGQFEELYCYCRSSVTHPPKPCGTQPPLCTKLCSRTHNCDHPITHNCHMENNCPPCTTLTEKWCYGRHELRKSVPCHVAEFSCGLPCNKLQSCKKHKCINICHSGPCSLNCTQPCLAIRESCNHPCLAHCHEDTPCPSTPCKEKTTVNCICGHLSMKIICCDNESDYRKLRTSYLASNLDSSDSSVDISNLMNGTRNRKLECNDECQKIERDKRLALALQIENPGDTTSRLGPPKYSEFLKDFTRREQGFASEIHEKLTDLVKLARESKQKSRQYSFPIMKREKREFIHDYASHFGIDTESFDAEPHRNVMATAVKFKIWLPSLSLIDFVLKQRRPPGPINNSIDIDVFSSSLSSTKTSLCRSSNHWAESFTTLSSKDETFKKENNNK